MAKRTYYYAVKVGRTTGILTSWDECLEATKGYSGAVFKKFPTIEEAQAWLNGASPQADSGTQPQERTLTDTGKHSNAGIHSNTSAKPEIAVQSDTAANLEQKKSGRSFEADYDVYTDGSFSGDRYSWAYVFVRDGEIVYEESDVGKNPEAAAMRNVAGEIAAVLYAVKRAAKLGARIRIHHDYAGIAHWVNGEWKANNPFTQLYVKLMHQHRGLYEFAKVPAHSGNRFNDYVDQKAKAALEQVSDKHTGYQ